jgi:hypothetical protein
MVSTFSPCTLSHSVCPTPFHRQQYPPSHLPTHTVHPVVLTAHFTIHTVPRCHTPRFRGILHEGEIDKRVQYMIERLFADRKAGFADNPAVPPALDLIDEDDQVRSVHPYSIHDRPLQTTITTTTAASTYYHRYHTHTTPTPLFNTLGVLHWRHVAVLLYVMWMYSRVPV